MEDVSHPRATIGTCHRRANSFFFHYSSHCRDVLLKQLKRRLKVSDDSCTIRLIVERRPRYLFEWLSQSPLYTLRKHFSTLPLAYGKTLIQRFTKRPALPRRRIQQHTSRSVPIDLKPSLRKIIRSTSTRVLEYSCNTIDSYKLYHSSNTNSR